MNDDYDAMPAAEVCALVAMIGVGNRWPSKAQLVTAIASVEGGDWWTAKDLAAHVGLKEGTCRELLAELARERVILRDGGSGERRYWVEVNPRWEEWRVPWRVDRVDVRRQLADVRERRSRTDYARFIAVSRAPRYPRINAVLMARDRRRQAAADALVSRSHGDRDNGGVDNPVSRSHGHRETGGGYRGPMGTAINRGSSAPYSSSLERSIDLSTTEEGEERREGQQSTVDGQAAIAAVEAATGGSVYGPRLAAEIERMTAEAGLDAVLAAVNSTSPVGLQPPGFVSAVRRTLMAGPAPKGPDPWRPDDRPLGEVLDTSCAACNGSGWTLTEPVMICPECHGTRTRTDARSPGETLATGGYSELEHPTPEGASLP